MRSVDIVFNNKNLKSLIFNFIKNEKCISCRKNIFFENVNNNILDYRNYKWRDSIYIGSNKNSLKNVYVCNWCYYYVWEYR